MEKGHNRLAKREYQGTIDGIYDNIILDPRVVKCGNGDYSDSYGKLDGFLFYNWDYCDIYWMLIAMLTLQ